MSKVKNSVADMVLPGGGTGTRVTGGNGFLGQTGDTFLLAGFSLVGSGCFNCFASRVMMA